MKGREIDHVFNEAGKAILELLEDWRGIEQRLGTKSKITLSRARQIQALTDMHTLALKAIEQYRKALHLSAITSQAKDVIIYKYETGLSWEKSFKANGLPFDKESGDKIDRIDKLISDLIEKAYKDNGERI